MDFTKQEMLNKNGFDFEHFEFENEYSVKNLLASMDEYAEQEAKAYASWLSNTVIQGRTASKLWADYKAEIGKTV